MSVEKLSERDWLRMKKEIEFKMVEEWGRYAPNVNMENFISAWIATPDDVVNREPMYASRRLGRPGCPLRMLRQVEAIS